MDIEIIANAKPKSEPPPPVEEWLEDLQIVPVEYEPEQEEPFLEVDWTSFDVRL